MSNSNSSPSTESVIQDAFSKVWAVICMIFTPVGHFFKILFGYMYRLRKILLAIPVVVAAVSLAGYCRARMPQVVGIAMQENGEYAAYINRDLAVVGSLLITGVCLLMMFCSRRTLYPWLISIFSLVLPILIMGINMIFLPF